MSRIVVVVLLAVLLVACGFRLRGSQSGDAPELDLGPLQVVSSNQESDLGDRLVPLLERAGATTPATGEKASVLRLLAERWADRPLTVDSNVEVREFITVYTVEFELVGADGSARVPRQQIELSREYTFDVNAAGGTPAERLLIQEELSREMAAAVLRRIAAAERTGH